jgi:esterase/lipase superfamily enzyme
VVRAIGVRLASGQPLGDATYNIGEAVGVIAVGTAGAVGNVAAKVVTAPFERPEPVSAQPAQ